MARQTAGLLRVLLCSVLVSSCSMTAEERDQWLGGALGAATGAAIGAAAGHGDPGAIAAGAVGGAVVGWGAVKLVQYHAEKTQSAAETDKVMGYTPGQGPMVRIRGARVVPEQVKRGDRLTFETEYTLAGPNAATPVRETWELWKDNQLLSTVPPQSQTREPGGWLAKASVDAPGGASPGTYVVKNRVEAGTSYDERLAVFTIS
jgi:hypothetical protein